MLTLVRLLVPLLLILATLFASLTRQAHAAPPAARMPSDAEIAAQRGVMPNLPDAPTAKPAPRGLSDIAQQYERMLRGPGAGGQEGEDRTADRSVSGLLIFVSLSMPKPTLQALIADAQRSRALLVLRGVQDSSLRKTTQQIQALMGETKTAWNIDPSLYQRFAVSAVPTFVLIDPQRPVLVDCGSDRCQTVAHAKVAGDVSVDHALRAIASDDAEFAGPANAYLARLAARPRAPAKLGS